MNEFLVMCLLLFIALSYTTKDAAEEAREEGYQRGLKECAIEKADRVLGVQASVDGD